MAVMWPRMRDDYEPGSANPGQSLVKSADQDAWEPREPGGGGGALDATGQPSGHVPTAQGDDSWAWAAQAGGGGGDVLVSVSGSVTLSSTAPTGALYGYRATGTTTFTGAGGSVELDVGAYVFERTVSGWTYRTLDAGTALTGGGPIPVTATAPTFTDDAGTASDTYTIPSTTGVVYKVSGTVRAAGTYPGSGTVVVTAEAATGYTLTGTSTWTHTFSSGGADTTAPTGATLAVTGTGDAGSTRTLTVSGATDSESGLHATPYAFSTDGGSTWTSWQSSATYTTPALAAGTYSPRARVRDAASTPNVATISAADFTVSATSIPTGPVSVVALSSADQQDGGTPKTSWTFLGLNIGQASTHRLVVAAFSGTAVFRRTINSCTIGGVAATFANPGTDGGSVFIVYAYAVVPTGTTADVAVTLSGNTKSLSVDLFEVKNTKKTHAGAWTTSGTTQTVTIPTTTSGGVALAGSIWQGGDAATRNANWATATELTDRTAPAGSTGGTDNPVRVSQAWETTTGVAQTTTTDMGGLSPYVASITFEKAV